MDIVVPGVTNNVWCDAVARADGTPITAGTVNIYLVADGGANDGKWWRDSDTTWQAAETVAKAGTLAADGHWYANLKAAAFTHGQKYRAYARESGDLHVPVGKPVYCFALVTICTEARLAELDAGSLPADIADLQGSVDDVFDDVGDVQASVDLATTYIYPVNRALVLNSTTIATLASQTSFTLTAGSADDDAYNDCLLVVRDSATATQRCVGFIGNYTGATKTVTLLADPGVFTMAVGDYVDIIPGSVVGLSAAAMNAIADALLNRTGWTQGGARAVKTVLERIEAVVCNVTTISEAGVFAFKADDGTVVVQFQPTTAGRTVFV